MEYFYMKDAAAANVVYIVRAADGEAVVVGRYSQEVKSPELPPVDVGRVIASTFSARALVSDAKAAKAKEEADAAGTLHLTENMLVTSPPLPEVKSKWP